MSIQTDITSLAENTLALNQVIEGSDTTTVVTPEGNSIKSVSKMILEGSDAMTAAVNAMENDGSGAVALASAQVNLAIAEKEAAVVAKEAAVVAKEAAVVAKNAAELAETNAETAETNAGNSATTALNAITDAFKGTIAGGSVPATSDAAGDYYWISADGTSQSITWTKNDRAIYNGTSGSWTQIDSGEVTEPIIAGRFAARAPRSQVISDGATPNRALVQVGTARTNLAGAPVATWRGLVYVPTSNPNVSAYISARTSSLAGAPIGYLNGLFFRIETSGGFDLYNVGASGYFSRLLWPGFRAAYSGQFVEVEIYFVQGVTNPVIRANGVDITSEFSLTTGGSGATNWLDASMTNAFITTGRDWPSGPVPLGSWINGALSDADRTYWRTSGQPPAWVALGGSAADVFTQSWAGGADGWNATGAAAFENGVVELLAAGGSTGIWKSSLFPRNIGAKLRVEIDYNTNTAGDISMGGYVYTPGIETATRRVTVPDGTGTLGIIIDATRYNAASTGLQFYTITWTGTFSAIRVTQLGSLSLPVQGPDGIVLDGTRSDAPVIGTMTGMQWNRPLPVGESRGVTKIYAHDDISATAATTTAFILPAGYKLKEIQSNVTVAFDATLTADVGISGTPAKFASAIDLATTGLGQTTSLSLAPVSTTAATTIYLQKSGSTTVGAITLTFIVERIF